MKLLLEVHLGNLDRIKKLIDREGIPIDTKWSDYMLLRYALWRGQKEIAKLLIEKGCRINKRSKKSSNTPLHIAVKQEDVEIVRILLDKGASIESKNHNSETPLHFAAKTKNDIIIDMILKQVNSSNEYNVTEKLGLSHLHIACMRNDLFGIELLLLSEVAINTPVVLTSPFWPSYTPLHFAVEYERIEVVKLLLLNKADITAKNSKGLTPLHLAVQLKNTEIIDLILSAHNNCIENTNPMDDRGFSHFHAACMRNNPLVVEGFIQRGVTLNDTVSLESAEWPGYCPLHFAVESDCSETVELLVAFGADICIKEANGLTPLHFAINRDNKAIVDLILSAHINSYQDVNPVDKQGFSHFHAACMRNNPNVVQAFLQNSVDINCPISSESSNWPGYTPLHFAVENSCIEAVELLLQYGVNVVEKDIRGCTPLHLATVHQNIKIASMLLNSGADVHAKTKTGMRPLHFAVEKGSIELIEMFLRYKVDVNCAEFLEMSTPLHLATYYKHIKIIDLLLTNGADINVRKRDGKTALHTMAHIRDPKRELDMDLVESYSKIINILLENGSAIDIRDLYGRTPLHITCLYRNLAGAYALLQHGADINIEDFLGKTPLSYCMHVFHNTYYVFQDHIEKLKYINFYISEKNESCYMKLQGSYKRFKRKWRDVEDDEFLTKCEEELNRMRRVRLDNYSSLYNIIFKSINEMTLHVRNDTLKEIVGSSDFDKTYSLYGYLIKLQYKKGLVREVLMKPAKDSLEFLMANGVPDACAETIFKYMTNEDLHQLIEVKS